MITKDFIIINKSLPEVYKIASDIEKQHEYIPGYKPARIIEKKEDGEILIERIAEIKGKIMKWQSTAKFKENKKIEFKQIQGRLKDMKIEWLFEEIHGGTKITITHDFKLSRPIIGWFLEKFIAKPTINKLTKNVLSGLKKKMENIVI